MRIQATNRLALLQAELQELIEQYSHNNIN